MQQVARVTKKHLRLGASVNPAFSKALSPSHYGRRININFHSTQKSHISQRTLSIHPLQFRLGQKQTTPARHYSKVFQDSCRRERAASATQMLTFGGQRRTFRSTSDLPNRHLKIAYFTYVWPETTSSAAGVRCWQLATFLKSKGCELLWFSHSKPNQFSERIKNELDIPVIQFPLNSSLLDDSLKQFKLDAVVYDRFIMEEQVGHRVHNVAPNALKIIDTQDLHSLRRFREEQVTKGVKYDFGRTEEAVPDSTSSSLLRELASIHRCDLALMVSDFEMVLLDRYGVSPNKLALVPFLYSPQEIETYHELAKTQFSHRKNFVTIGGFKHSPNRDQVEWLKSELWPKLRQQVPNAQLHVYGSYPTEKIYQMHDPKQGFLIKGSATDQYETLSKYRVSLATVRFGAGIKGKVVDSWLVGTPVVANWMGAEGLTLGSMHDFGGKIAESVEDFVAKGAQLYNDQTEWERAHEELPRFVDQIASETAFGPALWHKINHSVDNIGHLRNRNMTGQLLHNIEHNWQKAFSSFLETKSKLNLMMNPTPDSINSFDTKFTQETIDDEKYQFRLDHTNPWIDVDLSWEQLTNAVKKGQLRALGRTKDVALQYRQDREKVREEYHSLGDRILEREFGCPTTLDENGRKKAIVSKKDIDVCFRLTQNLYRIPLLFFEFKKNFNTDLHQEKTQKKKFKEELFR